MKTKNIITLIATVFTAAIFNTAAHAENIGNGSIRVTVSAEEAANLKVRYLTEDSTEEQSIGADEVLHLSSFNVIDNGGDLPELQPKMNSFNLVKEGTTGLFIMGSQEDELVRLSFEKAGIHQELLLDFQWTPKVELLIPDTAKVEVLNNAEELVFEASENPQQVIASNGMPIRFVVEGQEGGDENPDNQPNPNDGDDVAPAPEAGATGSCSMVNAGGSNPTGALLLVLPALFAAVRRIRR